MQVLCATTPFGPVPCFFGWDLDEDWLPLAMVLNTLPPPFGHSTIASVVFELDDAEALRFIMDVRYVIFRWYILQWASQVNPSLFG